MSDQTALTQIDRRLLNDRSMRNRSPLSSAPGLESFVSTRAGPRNCLKIQTDFSLLVLHDESRVSCIRSNCDTAFMVITGKIRCFRGTVIFGAPSSGHYTRAPANEFFGVRENLRIAAPHPRPCGKILSEGGQTNCAKLRLGAAAHRTTESSRTRDVGRVHPAGQSAEGGERRLAGGRSRPDHRRACAGSSHTSLDIA
jgi:hypothetical protein